MLEYPSFLRHLRVGIPSRTGRWCRFGGLQGSELSQLRSDLVLPNSLYIINSRYSSKTSKAVSLSAMDVLDSLGCVPMNRSRRSHGSASKMAARQSHRVLLPPDTSIRAPESHPSRLRCANRAVHTTRKVDTPSDTPQTQLLIHQETSVPIALHCVSYDAFPIL